MSRKIKVGKIGLLDMLKFSNLPKVRQKKINATEAKEVTADFPINDFARKMHPDRQEFVVESILPHENAGAKTFVLKRADGESAAYFRAGQYLVTRFKIGDSLVSRPYSITSSPKDTEDGRVALTVKGIPGGFVSDWVQKNLSVGDTVVTSAPLGSFYYEGLRDCKKVIAVAIENGITPFLSMAYAIRDGIEDFDLTILYVNRREGGILCREELDAIAAVCPKVKVVYVLSEEQKSGFEYGAVTAEMIEKYAEGKEFSLFVQGREKLCRLIDKEAEKLGIDRKHYRRKSLKTVGSISEQPGYPQEKKDQTFRITVRQGAEKYEIDALASEPILTAIERAGIRASSGCRSGECGWCRSRLVSGSVYIPALTDGRRYADKDNGEIHPCRSYPTSDLTIAIPGCRDWT